MDCTSCHNPHSNDYQDISGNALISRFDDDQCLSCHVTKSLDIAAHTFHEKESDGSSCIACHMPTRQHVGIGNEIKYKRSDHTVSIPRPMFDVSQGFESACQQCHSDISEPELQEIIERSASILNIKIEKQGSEEIAKRSRGTPRIANRLLRRVRDFADVKTKGIINVEIAQEALEALKVDEAGLEQLDRDYLGLIIQKFSAGPVGLDTLATALGEERTTLEDMIEPYLLQQGFIMRTPRGRIATDLAFSHLGEVRQSKDQDLFSK